LRRSAALSGCFSPPYDTAIAYTHGSRTKIASIVSAIKSRRQLPHRSPFGTKVTDAGLVHLKPLPKLTKRKVSRTAVTDQGVKDAKKFLPFFATVTR